MSEVIADDQLQRKLNGLSDQVRLCDPSGVTIGYVLSPADYECLIYRWMSAQISDSDVERLSAEAKNSRGRTLDEIWRDLGVR